MVIYESEFETKRLKFKQRIEMGHRMCITVEPRYNEGPRDRQNGFTKTRFRYIEVLFYIFHIFHYYWGKENRALNRGLRYIEVRYIEVLLY